MIQKLVTALKILGWLLKGLWYTLVIATPVLGFWLASSLAAYLNGPIWAAALAGVLAFPLLPLAWEMVGHWRRQKKVARLRAQDEEVRQRILTLADRVVLRTLAINLVFLSVLAGLFPQDGFTALSTRGDWMLTGNDKPWADKTRDVVFEAAGGLEWLYNSTRDNPYEKWAEADDDDEPVPEPVAGKVERAKTSGEAEEKESEKESEEEAASKESSESKEKKSEREAVARDDGPPQWPMPAELHPAVANIPASQETSPEAVAKYIAASERDPYLRVKAMYDYVTDRVRYDAPALARGDYPPQDANTVFTTGKAVCAGYAKLLVKMSETIGLNMVYVTGVSRDRGGNVGGSGHAWNAVEIDGQWYLIDATWGAGYVEDDTFHKRYSTDYLFTPPDVLGVDHFPDDAKWQLRDQPITRGEFMRLPILRAAFFQRGFELIDPRRSQISVGDEVRLTLERPSGQHLIASLHPRSSSNKSSSSSSRCEVSGDATVGVRCQIDRPGTYEVRLFANDTREGRYEFIGQIEANSR